MSDLFSPERLRGYTEQFDLAGNVLSVKPYGNGHVNDTFRVEMDTGLDYVLQRISPVAFPRPDLVMENVVRVTGHLRQQIVARGGNPLRETLTPVATPDGRWWIQDEEGGVWRVYVCIADVVSHEQADTPDVFREAGRAFGAFAMQLADFPIEQLHETIAHFHDTPARLAALERAAEENRAGRAAGVLEELAFVRERSGKASLLMDQLHDGTLPLKVTHNDTKLNNVLCDRVTGRAICVLDLDTVMPGLIAFDFGDAIRYGANTAAEDERDPEKIHFSMPMFRAWTEGYLEEAGASLSAAEKRSLTTGCWMMTYELATRFLADYLDGDRYFHVAYPEHNLVRARNQLLLLKDMEDCQQAMDDFIINWKGDDQA